MSKAREAKIKAVVDAWVVPGVSVEFHERAKTHLAQPTANGGWPVLERAVRELAEFEQRHSRRWWWVR